MQAFKNIRWCFERLNANDNRPGLKHLLYVNETLLLITFAAFQSFGAYAWALPMVIKYGHITDRFGAHSIPGLPVGDRVQVYATIESSDLVGSPSISVEAIQVGTTLALDRIPPEGMFQGRNEFYKFIDLDVGLAGPWEIIPTDSTGTGPSTFTNAIAEPEFLPLVEDIAVQGTPLGVKVAWTVPNLDRFDVDGLVVRVLEVTSGRHMWQCDPLSAETTSFQVPAVVLQDGVDYSFMINLGDAEIFYLENSSKAFSEPFRFTALTVNGDFNLDGMVDAADYVVWRNGLGTVYSQNHYAIWRSHFGQTASSGSAGYPLGASAEPQSAAVPEPATLVLLKLVTVGVIRHRHRSLQRVSETISK
jgi:hypothetical protein